MANSENEIRGRLNQFLVDQLGQFDPEKPLWRQVDSLQLLTLITRIEEEFQIKIYSIEATGPAFQSLDGMTQLLLAKLAR